MYHTPPRDDEKDDLRSALWRSGARNQDEDVDKKMMRDRSPRYQRRRSRSRSRDQERNLDRRDTFRRSLQDRSPQHWRRGEENPRFRSGGHDRDGPPDRRKLGRWERDDSAHLDSEEEGADKGKHRRDSGRKDHGRSKKNSLSDSMEPERKSRSRRKGSRSHSRSSSGGGDGQHSCKDRRDKKKRAPGEPATMTSKWARHRDHESGDLSTSEEDRELERAFQKRKKKEKGKDGGSRPDEEDLFGLNKLLPVP